MRGNAGAVIRAEGAAGMITARHNVPVHNHQRSLCENPGRDHLLPVREDHGRATLAGTPDLFTSPWPARISPPHPRCGRAAAVSPDPYTFCYCTLRDIAQSSFSIAVYWWPSFADDFRSVLTD